MFAITGITGQVGGAVARTLLARGYDVRGVARDRAKAAAWRTLGARISFADFMDREQLTEAFSDVEGVFVMIPPMWDPTPGFPEALAIVASLRHALEAAAPPKIVCLSSIGAQRSAGLGLITQLRILERELGRLPMPRAFLRAAWFMENAIPDVVSARESGVLPSHLSPLDRAIPMVSATDVGAVAADVLTQEWDGVRTIEVEGPRAYSPHDIAAVLTDLLGRPVSAVEVPRSTWGSLFRNAGQANPAERIRMLDGFNSGWISFQERPAERIAGPTRFEDVLRPAIVRSAHAA